MMERWSSTGRLAAGLVLAGSLLIGGAGGAGATALPASMSNVETTHLVPCKQHCKPIKPEEPGPKGGTPKKRPPSGGGIPPEGPGPKNPPRPGPDNPGPKDPPRPVVDPPGPRVTQSPGGNGTPFVAKHPTVVDGRGGSKPWDVVRTVKAAPVAAAPVAAPVAAAPVASAPVAVAAVPSAGVGMVDQSLWPALLALAGAGAAASVAVQRRRFAPVTRANGK